MAVMKNKAISFNIDNPKEKRLFEQIQDIENFSAYAKSLIDQDIRKSQVIVEVGKK